MSLVTTRSGAFASVALLGLVSVPLVVKFTARAAAVAVVESQGAATASVASLDVALTRAGLDPRTLAAAGVSGAQVSALTAAAAAHIAQAPDALRSADQAYAQARVEHDALERKVASGLASSGEIASLASARAALDSARALRVSRLSALYEAGASVLSSEQRTRLSTLRANAGKPGPIEFKAVERTEAEWLSLRKALANERISAQCGDQPHAGCQSLLSSARSNASVAAAKSACDTNLAAIQSAWSTAVGG